MRYLNGVFFVLLFLLFSTTTEMHTVQAAEVVDKSLVTAPVVLFNGKNLEGWEAIGKARWDVEDGILTGRQGPNGEAGDLLTVTSYDDFELAVTFRMKWPGNSGVWFRYQTADKAYQADILEHQDPIAYSGSLYCPGKVFIATNDNSEIVDREGWNKLVIRAQGDRLVIHINEKKVADVRDDSSTHGKIGLQVHQGDVFTGMQIMVKEFSLRPL
jgi:hypothetical protein